MKVLRRAWRQLVQLPPLQSGLIIFAVALIVRLAFLLAFHTYRDLSRVELERTAISLAHTGVFGNPYAVPTGPTAHVAPGYTLILAAIFKIFGTGIPGEIVKRCLASLVSSILWALLPALSSQLLLSASPGVLAGLAGALYPARPLVEIEGDWETPYTALALVLITFLTYRLWTKRDLRPRQAAWHGLLWGISLLFVPALLDIFIVLVACGTFFCSQTGVGRYLRFAGIEIAVAALCLVPWVVRNYEDFGGLVITRTNLGLELRISNNDEASPDQRINSLSGLFDRYHPLDSKPDARKVRELGEIRYNSWAENEAKQWIRTHPRRFLELCLGRARCYWFYYDPNSIGKTLILAATTVLGFLGFFYIVRQNHLLAVVFGLLLLLYPLPNYLVHVGLRQEYPLHWLMTLLAAVWVLRWVPAKA